MYVESQMLNVLANTVDQDKLAVAADLSVSLAIGYQSDRMAIFTAGVGLGQKAGTSDIVRIQCDAGTFFFIGSISDVAARLQVLPLKVKRVAKTLCDGTTIP